MGRREPGNSVDDGVDERGLAGRCAADHNNVLALAHGLFNDGNRLRREGAGKHVFLQGENPAGLFAQRK